MSGGRLAQANTDIDTLAAGGKLARTRDTTTSDSLTDYSKPGPSQSSILFEARIVPAAQVPGWQVLPPARDRKGKVVGDARDQPFVIEYAALSKET